LRQRPDRDDLSVTFIDDAEERVSSFAGLPVQDWSTFKGVSADRREVVIAIAAADTRRRLAERCSQDDISMLAVVAANAYVADEAKIAEGAVIQPFVTVTSNAIIGRCFHANIYSYVAHDCSIGDFVTFAPGVMCNGNVSIGDGAYIGTGAILRQGTPTKPLLIGKGAIIGMGAVVTKDVPPGVTVVGNPARPMVKS
ncbi:MAG: acetyltransferase, partial [Sphingomonas sp.]